MTLSGAFGASVWIAGIIIYPRPTLLLTIMLLLFAFFVNGDEDNDSDAE